MNQPIVCRARIQQKARSAATTYNDVNDACPYPFGTEAADLFKAEFTLAWAIKGGMKPPRETAAQRAAAEQAAQ